MKLNKISRAVITDVTALLLVLLIGEMVWLRQHIPLAITALQALGLELLVLALPASRLKYDKDRHKVRDTHDRQVVFEIIISVLIAAGLAYLNYLWFYGRHNLSAAYIDTTSDLYRSATTLVLLTFTMTQTLNLIFIRADAESKLMPSLNLKNKKLVQAWLLSAFVLLNMIYDPLLQAVFKTKSLGFMDWISAAALALVYFGLRLLQRHTREHTRHAVIKLHRETKA